MAHLISHANVLVAWPTLDNTLVGRVRHPTCPYGTHALVFEQAFSGSGRRERCHERPQGSECSFTALGRHPRQHHDRPEPCAIPL